MNELNSQVLKEFIKEKFKISPHKVPFYLKWIGMYYRFSKKLGFSDNTRDDFINTLYSQYPDWQIEQAEKAVSIYLSFIGKDAQLRTQVQTKDNLNWNNVIFNMKEEIRLQNKSLQTERTYIYWVKKFSTYISTTMIYTHIASRNKLGVVSPMDELS